MQKEELQQILALNRCFSSHLQDLLAFDPLADISKSLEKYVLHRNSIKSKTSSKDVAKISSSSAGFVFKNPESSGFSFVPEKTSTSEKPKESSVVSGFVFNSAKNFNDATTTFRFGASTGESTALNGSERVDSIPAASSGFLFTPMETPKTSSESTNKPFNSAETKNPQSSFNSTKAAESTIFESNTLFSNATKPKPLDSSGISDSTKTPESKQAETQNAFAATPFTFNSNKSFESTGFSFAPKPTEFSNASTPFSFGKPFDSSQPTTQKSTEIPSFGVTPSASNPFTTPFSFNKSGNSEVVFGSVPLFKVPAPISSENTDRETSGAGFELPVPAPQEDGEGGPSEDLSDAQINSQVLMHGQGEENETCVAQIRVKAFKTIDKEWKPIGLGILMLKKSTAHRILMRADGGGRVLINAAVFAAMKVEVADKKSFKVSVVGEDGGVFWVLFRCKDSQVMDEFVVALKACIEEIKQN